MKPVKSNIRDLTHAVPNEQKWHRGTFPIIQRLMQLLDGRFCVNIIAADKCPGTTVQKELQKGEKVSLSFGFAYNGGTVSATVEHEVKTTRKWSLGPCDTDDPVVCVDGQVRIMQKWIAPLIMWEEAVMNVGPQTVHLNVVKNDPSCGCKKKSAAAVSQSAFIRDEEAIGRLSSSARTISSFALLGTELDNKFELHEFAPAFEKALLTDDVSPSGLVSTLAAIDFRGRSHMLFTNDPIVQKKPVLAILVAGACRQLGPDIAVSQVGSRELPIFALANLPKDHKVELAVVSPASASHLQGFNQKQNGDIAHGEFLTFIRANIKLEAVPDGRGALVLDIKDGEGCVIHRTQVQFSTPDLDVNESS